MKRNMNIKEINLTDYNYDLPSNRIAQYPAIQRDKSKLLINHGGSVSEDQFSNIYKYLPAGSLLVFNNTRVIRARIMFRKETGALIEILCLEPLSPAEYELSFGSREGVEWKCIVGNLKKWKSGTISTTFALGGEEHTLSAKRICQDGDAWRIHFEWGSPGVSFGEVIEATGQLPLPPYLERETEPADLVRYQTVYSSKKGSVAAPTAGLHFTEKSIESLKERGINVTELTLHVGAGTFKPIKAEHISGHEMHCEHFFITRETIETIMLCAGRIIPVGTTSVRTLESLYWLGARLASAGPGFSEELSLGQWEPYEQVTDISVKDSMEAILNYMKVRNSSVLQASTSIIIVPGYKFRMINGIITNFHQPMSTLLLLISAWVGDEWKKIYRFALENDFRFLSYGDSSLLFR
jgi:S-adenosylmethionine:tRNA ribosyltransferase-isomerase